MVGLEDLPVEKDVAIWVAEVVVSIENGGEDVEETEAKDTA